MTNYNGMDVFRLTKCPARQWMRMPGNAARCEVSFAFQWEGMPSGENSFCRAMAFSFFHTFSFCPKRKIWSHREMRNIYEIFHKIIRLFLMNFSKYEVRNTIYKLRWRGCFPPDKMPRKAMNANARKCSETRSGLCISVRRHAERGEIILSGDGFFFFPYFFFWP